MHDRTNWHDVMDWHVYMPVQWYPQHQQTMADAGPERSRAVRAGFMRLAAAVRRPIARLFNRAEGVDTASGAMPGHP